MKYVCMKSRIEFLLAVLCCMYVCRLIFYGILLGLRDHVCVLAAALSLSKTLFRVASPFIHTNPAELNDIIKTTLIGAAKIDDGMERINKCTLCMYVWIDMYVCMYGNILFTYIYVCIGVCWDDVCSSSFC